MRYSLLILLALDVAFGYSQASLTVDRMNATIGDQIHVTIKTNMANGQEWINQNEIWPDTIKQFDIVSGPDIRHDDPASVSATWTIALFDTGWVRIPVLPVVIKTRDQHDTIFTNDIPLRVQGIEPDSSGLIPIKEIYKQPFNIAYYKKYIPHLLVLAAIIIGIIYWWRHRKKKEEVKEQVVLEPLPHDWAFNALRDLEGKRLWQSGEVKEHYTLLTAILREYLERRYEIRALEHTSDEILDQLKRLQLKTELLEDTSQLLSVSDLIKFAKADPGIDLHAATIERVRSFVKQTMLIPSVITDSQVKTNPDAPVA